MRKSTVIIILCVIFAVFALSACQGTTSLSIADAQMTTALDSNNSSIDNVTSYNIDAEQFIVTATVNAPEDTMLIFVWKQGSNIIYTSEKLDVSDTNEYLVYATLTNDQIWDEGDYSVEIYVNDDTQPTESVDFTVTGN